MSLREFRLVELHETTRDDLAADDASEPMSDGVPSTLLRTDTGTRRRGAIGASPKR